MKLASTFRNSFVKNNFSVEANWPVFSNAELLAFLKKKKIVDNKIEFTIDGRIFCAFLNKNGNVARVVYMGLSVEKQIEQIGEYTDEERSCSSDIGSIVINGIAFSNGYGDGLNSVVVRTFTKRPNISAAWCRAQIFNKADFHQLQAGAKLRIESYDCNPAGTGNACFEGPATGFVQHGRKVWVIIDKSL